ncbi:hypothetical protein [Streptomyces sp. NPDC056194]|uniref:hypothetical protein n=1 Tax=Streptomyces sp. NPDC056194 TaxID=3345744 RepID=UPI0035DBB768
MFGVSLKMVDIWWARWQAGGREALVMRPRGKPVGVHPVLGEAEQAAVRQAVLGHRPCDMGAEWAVVDAEAGGRVDREAVPGAADRGGGGQVPQTVGAFLPAPRQAGRRAGP